MTTKLLREAEALLRVSGLPYELVPSRKHHEVRLYERMVLVLSNGNSGGRDLDKLKSAINRAREAHI